MYTNMYICTYIHVKYTYIYIYSDVYQRDLNKQKETHEIIMLIKRNTHKKLTVHFKLMYLSWLSTFNICLG